MDPRSAELLELSAVRERLAGLTSFAGGRALALALAPSAEPSEVAGRGADTEEALRLRDLGVGGPGGAFDVREPVAAAARDAALDAEALSEVLATARVHIEAREAVTAREETAPRLAAALAAPDLGAVRRVEAALDRALDPAGGLLDTASPELASIRRRLAAARREASDLLRQLAVRLRSHLQETFTTERGGRPVLAVKASSRSAVPGIVHDSSGSGETIFVEPMAVVEANNRVRELGAQEHEEEERILRALSRLVGQEAGPLEDAVAALAALDLALASAALSRAWEGCPVEPADEVELAGARHPLLDPAGVVPIDLPLAGVRALVVSGPNTGGKTVALKTLGLFAMLHQCGLRVPASRARLPVFDRVLADIGDDQSIAESLSTFSAHVRRLVAIMEAAGPRSLVLLDEPAAGTDPDEGARLAQAVIERLVEQGALVLATTHHPEVKAWASAAPAAANAAVAVDLRTLRPLYTLQMGEPGASHALGIAEGLGLDPEVVEAARRAGPPERRALEALLADAASARAAAEEEREAAARAREEAEAARAEAGRRADDLAARIARAREAADRRARRGPARGPGRAGRAHPRPGRPAGADRGGAPGGGGARRRGDGRRARARARPAAGGRVARGGPGARGAGAAGPRGRAPIAAARGGRPGRRSGDGLPGPGAGDRRRPGRGSGRLGAHAAAPRAAGHRRRGGRGAGPGARVAGPARRSRCPRRWRSTCAAGAPRRRGPRCASGSTRRRSPGSRRCG